MANRPGTIVIFNVEQISDIKNDVRFRHSTDIRNDVRFTDEIEVLKSIRQDVRFVTSLLKDINQDVRFLFDGIQDVNQDVRWFFLSYNFIKEDIRFDKIYYKELYGNYTAQKESESNLYGYSTVLQPTPTIPAGLTATDMLKGDLIKLIWTDDANYGYNVYKTAPGGRTKMNSYAIQTTEFLVGNLTEGTTYTFVIVGVNGAGTESADSTSVSKKPTFPDFVGGATRFIPYTTIVKVNGSTVTDSILQTVELGYGTSPAIARFAVPRDPEVSGLPQLDDAVECIVNGKSIFKGIIKNREKSVSSSGMAVTYIAYSKIIEKTYESVPWDYILNIRGQYNLDITDQTWLQAYEAIANFKGNYRIYYDMNTDTVETYKLGTGYWNRNVTIGKNVIDWSVSEDVVNKVTKVTVRGARKKYVTSWKDLEWNVRIIAQGWGWYTYVREYEIDAFNIGEIQIEALESIGEPEFEFYPDISVVPSDFGLEEWEEDRTIEPKQAVKHYSNSSNDWRSAGTEINYEYRQVGNEQIPIKAFIRATSYPVIKRVHVVPYFDGIRRGRTPAEDINIGSVMLAFETFESASPYRISYSYEEELPEKTISGSGVPSRTVTDTQYSKTKDDLNGEDDSIYVQGKMNERAISEREKVNRPIVNGRIRILGDEHFNLKTLVKVSGEMLDVIRVTHDFTSGFTTEMEITNEKFRVNIPPYQEQRKTVEYQRKTTGTQNLLDFLQRKINQLNQTTYTEQKASKAIPKSPFALYGD